MSTVSPEEAVLFAGVGTVVVFACVVFLREKITLDLSRPQLLLLVTVVCPLGTVGVAAGIEYNANTIDYTVDQCGTHSAETNFSELSPAAQEVFRSTLQANGEYTTQTHPDDLVLERDTGATNYIRYESECYALRGSYRGDFGTGFVIWLVYLIGGVVTLVFFGATALDYALTDRSDTGRTDR
ncbi:hypothetical protein [Halovenus sp. HT40]|uniref:hypothetical protein n=1 Tax=Halovenus sp. HT40 TaxID=3126691 RepID=UPI00300F3752